MLAPISTAHMAALIARASQRIALVSPGAGGWLSQQEQPISCPFWGGDGFPFAIFFIASSNTASSSLHSAVRAASMKRSLCFLLAVLGAFILALLLVTK